MEKRYEETLLYDFYGELLTEKQRMIFEEAVMDDCSLGEVAEEHGISRQGVHDMLKRCTKLLYGYEAKLGLVDRFLKIKKVTEEIRERTDDEEIMRLTDEILEEL